MLENFRASVLKQLHVKLLGTKFCWQDFCLQTLFTVPKSSVLLFQEVNSFEKP